MRLGFLLTHRIGIGEMMIGKLYIYRVGEYCVYVCSARRNAEFCKMAFRARRDLLRGSRYKSWFPDLLSLSLFFPALIFHFDAGHALECYVCTDQEGNQDKCLNTIKTCEQGQDVCLTEIRWGSKCALFTYFASFVAAHWGYVAPSLSDARAYPYLNLVSYLFFSQSTNRSLTQPIKKY